MPESLPPGAVGGTSGPDSDFEVAQSSYAAIFDAAPVAMLISRRDGGIVMANREADALFGYAPGALVGRSIEVLVPAVAQAGYQPHRQQYFADGAPARGVRGRRELLARRKDGSEFVAEIQFSPVPTRDTGLILSSVRDLTERQHLEEQFRQAQKMEAVGQLAGGIAHDFNNLISVVLSYSSMLLRELEPGAKMREDLEEIKKAGERAASLTRQLLAFSRKQLLRPEIVDLSAVARTAERMLRPVIGEDIQLVTNLAERLPPILVDPNQIEQVIMNLAVNARDAMPRGGTLTLESRVVVLGEAYALEHEDVTPGKHVMLGVSDTGTGMPPGVVARIFEPFFTTKEQGKGTGLGLSTVYGIVMQSGGNISVYSEPGLGTSFKLYFPVVEGSGLPAERPTTRPASLRGSETILLVEDDEQVRAVAREILRRHGYQVLEARNGGEALLICERHDGPIQLVVTDVVMPHLSGPQLAERLRVTRPGLPVVYVSGYTANAIEPHRILPEGAAFVEKPLTPENLASKVREVLDGVPKG